MEDGKRRARIRRRRLVVLLLLLAALPLHGDHRFQMQGEGEEVRSFLLLGSDSVQSYRSSRFYRHPASYLLLLPGPVGWFVLSRRRRTAGLLLLAVALLLGAAAPFPAGLIDEGVRAFAAGRYDEALEAFEEAARRIGGNSALSYNSALCHYVSGRRGQAIYHLWESIRANPQAKIPREALTWIEAEAGLASQWRPPMPVHPNLPFVLMLFFFNISFAALLLFVRRRSGWLFITLVFTALLSVAGLSLFIRAAADGAEAVAVVVSGEGVLKKVPLDAAEPWMRLPEGSTLRVDGKADGYILVKTGRGLSGWIDGTALREIWKPRPEPRSGSPVQM